MLLKALDYCHSVNELVHRDIKATNILLSAQGLYISIDILSKKKIFIFIYIIFINKYNIYKYKVFFVIKSP